jgi:hypothetical protein
MHVTATDVIIGAIERLSSVLCSFCRNITIDRIDIDTKRLAQRGSEPLDLSQRLTVDTINNIRHNTDKEEPLFYIQGVYMQSLQLQMPF